MNLNDGCRMECCFLIATAWYGLHFARNHSTLGAYSRVQWILSPRTVHWFFFRDALRNSFGSEDPHFPRHIQNFAKPETSFGWEIQKPRQQHNQLLHYEQLKARRGVAMLVMCHTKVIVTSAKTSMSCKNSGWKPTFLLIWPIRWLALWHRCVDYNHVGDMLTDMLKPHLKVRMVTCVYVWVIVCTICKKRRQKGRHVMTCDNFCIQELPCRSAAFAKRHRQYCWWTKSCTTKDDDYLKAYAWQPGAGRRGPMFA